MRIVQWMLGREGVELIVEECFGSGAGFQIGIQMKCWINIMWEVFRLVFDPVHAFICG